MAWEFKRPVAEVADEEEKQIVWYTTNKVITSRNLAIMIEILSIYSMYPDAESTHWFTETEFITSKAEQN